VLRKKVAADQDFYRAYHRSHALNELAQIDRQIESVRNQKKDTTSKINRLERLRSKKKLVLRKYCGLIDDYESSNGEQARDGSSLPDE